MDGNLLRFFPCEKHEKKKWWEEFECTLARMQGMHFHPTLASLPSPINCLPPQRYFIHFHFKWAKIPGSLWTPHWLQFPPTLIIPDNHFKFCNRKINTTFHPLTNVSNETNKCWSLYLERIETGFERIPHTLVLNVSLLFPDSAVRWSSGHCKPWLVPALRWRPETIIQLYDPLKPPAAGRARSRPDVGPGMAAK